MNFKLLAMILLSAAFVYKLILSYFNYRSGSNPIPENVKDVYDEEAYKKWREYHAALSHLGLFSSTCGFVVDMILIGTNAYAAFASLFPQNVFVQMLAVILLLELSTLISIPFSYYQTFKIEEKFGFNRSTKKTF